MSDFVRPRVRPEWNFFAELDSPETDHDGPERRSPSPGIRKGLARELGSRRITANNVQPGPIETDLNPVDGASFLIQKAATALDHYGHADEVAALVAFVASPESSYITRANLTVDGGTNA